MNRSALAWTMYGLLAAGCGPATGPTPGADGASPEAGAEAGRDAGLDGAEPGRDGDTADAPLDASAAASTLVGRDALPVVLTGSDLASVAGVPTGELVFFRWQTGAWEPIPFQIDERRAAYFQDVYGSCSHCVGDHTTAGLFYADTSTFTGADPNPRVDLDDEIAFMAQDTGGAPSSVVPPAGVDPGFVVRYALSDPLDARGVGYVFAFRDRAHAAARSTRDYVSYHFVLTSGDYRTTYNLAGLNDSGLVYANPENSTVAAGSYARHFSSRWISDGVQLEHGGTLGPNLIEMHDAQFAPGVCGRSVATFASGEGAYVANIDGPVRAIRDHMGANSGPLTEGIYRFYAQVEDLETRLRVHEIGGVMEFIDYSHAAIGMQYSDTLNGPLTIDGVPDAYVPGPIDYQVVSGTQGSLTHALGLETNITPLAVTSYYLDADPVPASLPQCVGDDAALGNGAARIAGTIPVTDPRPVRGLSRAYLRTHRLTRYSADPTSRAQAIAFAATVHAPLVVRADVLSAPTPACGDGICEATETTAACAGDCAGSTIACGDGRCEPPEDDYACAADCMPAAVVCGDGVCDGAETHASCGADCEVFVCGDGACRGETAASCPADCTTPLSTCGDFMCEPPAETATTCAFDCAARCGDGACNGGETGTTCPADCGGGGAVCGDGTCSAGETGASCVADCATACAEAHCASQVTACGGTAGCTAIVHCVLGCGATSACVTGCMTGSSAANAAAASVVSCGRSNACLPAG